MGTTSDKLTYLNTTKTKIKDAINLANTSITNETFRLYEEKIKQAIINTMLDKWKVWNNFNKVTGSGTGLTLNNTHKAPLKLDLNENTYQYSTTGKNLANINVITDLTSQGAAVHRRIINDTIVLSDNTNSIGYANTEKKLSEICPNLQVGDIVYLFFNTTSNMSNKNIIYIGEIWTKGTSKVITDTMLNTNLVLYGGYNETAIISNFMITKVNDSTYELYTNGASPNPDYPQDIHLVSGDNTIEIYGKNLFDKDTCLFVSDKRYNDSGQIVNDSNSSYSSLIRVQPNTTYTISNLNGEQHKGVRTALFDINKTFIQRTEGIQENTITITTTSTTYYLSIQGRETSAMNIDTIQMEKGDQSTTYEAYTGNSQLISLGVENLFDKDITPENYVYNNSGVKVSTNDACINQEINNTDFNSIYISFASKTGTPYVRVCEYNSSGTFIKRTLVSANQALTLDSNTRKLIFSVNASSTNNFTDLMIEKGSKANSYSEYGKKPIEYCGIGDNKNKFIRTSGKNLFDKDNANIVKGTVGTTEFTYSSSASNRTIYISCKPNTTYTIQKRNDGDTNRFAVGTCSQAIDTSVDNATTPLTNRVADNSASNLTITSGANDIYLLVMYYRTAETILTEQQVLDSIQIEQNNQATEYNPYGSDEWYFKKAINRVVLDGSEDWQYYSTSKNPFRLPISDIYNVTNQDLPLNILSNNYIAYAWNETTSSGTHYTDNYLITQAAGQTISFRNNDITSLADWKIWLSTHNTIVNYVLETPTYTKITDYTLLSQLEAIYNAISMQGVTNILQENNDLPFNIDATALEVI